MIVNLSKSKDLFESGSLVRLFQSIKHGILLLSNKTDLELIKAVSGGDRNGLGELYRRHAGRMHQLVSRFRFSHEEKEDIVHDLFLEVWEKAYEFNPDKGSVLTWLALRARSRSIDRFRKKTRRDHLLDMNVEVTRPREITPPGIALVERSELRSAILQLDDELIQVTMRAYFDGESTSLIAQELGIKQGTVKSRLRRARDTLHRELSGGNR